MLHVGLDLSRTRVDVCALDEAGEVVAVTLASPDAGGLLSLADRLAVHGEPVSAVIESMTGARFVHDRLEWAGWDVAIADAAKTKGLAPLTCKTDKIDARVLAELSRRDLVPEIWLPTPAIRSARELVRYRWHLVKHRTMLRNRIHSTLMNFGIPRRVSDLFGVTGRGELAGLDLPQPWAANVATCLRLVDAIDGELDTLDDRLRGFAAHDRYVPLLRTAPGIGLILGATISAEIGDIGRFSEPRKLVAYTGLCPRVYQSGGIDRRGNLTKNGPRLLRWAMIEASTHASRHPAYRAHYLHTRTRLGKQRGAKIARIEVARKLTEAIWHMLTDSKPFAPEGASDDLAA